jgi:hypothetical protein
VTYERVLDGMIGFINDLYIHTVRNYRQYSAIAHLHSLQFTVTHALRFSVFSSRILATDLNTVVIPISHMKSSFHSLIPFLPLFCRCQFRRLDAVQSQAHILAGWRLETRLLTLFKVKVEVTLRLTVRQSVSLVSSPIWGS